MRETIGYNKRHKDRSNGDYYATPPLEVKNILQYEKLPGTILEPCCGEGHIANMVKQIYPDKTVFATDLYNRGYGQTGVEYNFLSNNYPIQNVDSIIMNPPFALMTEFVLNALKIAKRKILLLARVQFLESKTRHEQIFKTTPPNKMYVYVDRISCGKNGIFDPKRIASMAYAWFVWEINNCQIPQIHWIRKYGLEDATRRLWN